MTTLVYVPGDAGALSLGAGEVARAIAEEAARRRAAVKVVRNGSRGAYWLEPLIEVLTPRGRLAYGPVTTGDVAGLFNADFLDGGSAARGFLSNRARYLAGPEGQGARVDRYVHQRCHGEGARSASSASKRSGVTRP